MSRWQKSESKPELSDSDIWQVGIDYIGDYGYRRYNRIVIYGASKKEAKEIRKKILKVLNEEEI